MLRHFITFIDYKKLIEMQANQVAVHLSKEQISNNKKMKYTKYDRVPNYKGKVRKIGKK